MGCQKIWLGVESEEVRRVLGLGSEWRRDGDFKGQRVSLENVQLAIMVSSAGQESFIQSAPVSWCPCRFGVLRSWIPLFSQQSFATI